MKNCICKVNPTKHLASCDTVLNDNQREEDIYCITLDTYILYRNLLIDYLKPINLRTRLVHATNLTDVIHHLRFSHFEPL